MDIKNLILSLACLLLATTAAIYGYKFLKKRNYPLGFEWLIVAISATNLMLFYATGLEVGYRISMFLDAFSRGFGVPFITVVGLMMVTHGYKPSKLVDIVVFVLAFAGTFVLILSDFMVKPLPYFYVAMWTLFSIYLAYFAKKLLSVGETRHAIYVILALVLSQAIANIYDFYKIPGEETNIVFNFFVLALVTWSFLLAVLYHAYCALERNLRPEGALQKTAVTASLTDR